MRILGFCLLLALVPLSGCAWIGEAAGYVQAKAEGGASDMKRGYNDGYNNEKRNQVAKPYTPPPVTTPSTPPPAFNHATNPKDLR